MEHMAGNEVTVLGWPVHVVNNVPRVRDIDLGERLGFARPADFRKLVKRLLLNGILNDVDIIATVARTKLGHGWRDVTEYHLDQTGALIAISKSETPLANAITRQMVEVFLAYTEGRLRFINDAPTIDRRVINSRAIGTSWHRPEYEKLCRSTAARLETRIGRIHGAIRREFRVGSPYAVSVALWPELQAFLTGLGRALLGLEERALPAPSSEWAGWLKNSHRARGSLFDAEAG